MFTSKSVICQGTSMFCFGTSDISTELIWSHFWTIFVGKGVFSHPHTMMSCQQVFLSTYIHNTWWCHTNLLIFLIFPLQLFVRNFCNFYSFEIRFGANERWRVALHPHTVNSVGPHSKPESQCSKNWTPKWVVHRLPAGFRCTLGSPPAPGQ